MNYRWITAFVLLGIGLACGHKPQSGKINIQIPWPDSSGYKLQFVPVGFTDLRNVSGPDVTFFDEPYVTSNSQTQRLVGASPVGKFSAISEGNYIPTTYKSLMLATVYAHMERLNTHLKDLGYGNLLTFPRRVGINPKITFENGRGITNNAIYYPALDGIFVFPYETTGLPLAFNGGVLAHEYFHAIFHQIFYRNLLINKNQQGVHDHFNVTSNIDQPYVCRLPPVLTNSCSQDVKYTDADVSSFILGAMNEGLADTWAWIYTDDLDFLGKSFGEELTRRKMSGDFCNLPTHQSVRDLWARVLLYRGVNCRRKVAQEAMGSYQYSYGTNLSRFLISFAQSGKMSRQELATTILQTLQKMNTVVDEKPGVNFDVFVNLFVETAKELKKEVSPEQCSISSKIISEGGVKACTK